MADNEGQSDFISVPIQTEFLPSKLPNVINNLYNMIESSFHAVVWTLPINVTEIMKMSPVLDKRLTHGTWNMLVCMVIISFVLNMSLLTKLYILFFQLGQVS